MPDFSLTAEGFGCITQSALVFFIFSYYFLHYLYITGCIVSISDFIHKNTQRFSVAVSIFIKIFVDQAFHMSAEEQEI